MNAFMAAVASQHGSSSGEAPTLRRRVSMEEDYFYQEVMTSPHRPTSQPPPYEPREKRRALEQPPSILDTEVEDEPLPVYSCDIALEAVFQRKMEVENTIKRAEDRHWTSVFVHLQGTALHVYRVKKNWGYTGKTGPQISPDNPPWMRKAGLEKTYTLLYADVGIAADYGKRRYVIRIRAETDQFLLSCIELETFVKWLDALFAAINVAPAIEEREFPRDYSIPRVARIRWFQGETGQPRNGTTSDPSRTAAIVHHSAMTPRAPAPQQQQPDQLPDSPSELEPSQARAQVPDDPDSSVAPAPLGPLPTRLSTTSYPNESVMPGTRKWRPRHQWTSAHDMIYAKLCYAVLNFRSPRKSNYVIMKGKKWFVDWATGKMVRVLPPGYGEVVLTGPFQVFSAENRRI